ncbi:hypothetical protein ACIU0H_20600 [Pseudomonas aeruginosa]
MMRFLGFCLRNMPPAFWAVGLLGSAMAAENCQLHIAPAVADYGQQYRQTILGLPPVGGGRSLGRREMTVQVACREPVELALFLQGDGGAGRGYRLDPQGLLELTAEQAMLDGRAVALGVVEQRGQVPSESVASVTLQPGKGIAIVEQGLPARGSRLTLRLVMDVQMPVESLTAIGGEMAWVGNPMLELVER